MDQNQEKISWLQLQQSDLYDLNRVDLCGLSGSAAVYAAAQVFRKQRQPMVIVVPTARDAEQTIDELRLFLRDLDSSIGYFPPYHVSAFKHIAFHNETAARRIQKLYQFIELPGNEITITTVDALVQKVMPKSELIGFAELVMVGEESDRDHLISKLISGGFSRAAVVEEPGDFGLRGGIIDLFSPLHTDPVRIEFFGDLVESIRLFSAETQRTVGDLNEVVILPARETIIAQSKLNTIIGRIRKRASEMDLAVTQVRQLIQKIKTEGIFPGFESLSPLVYGQMNTLFDFVPKRTLWVMMEPAQLAAAAEDFETLMQRSYTSACEKRDLCVEPSDLYQSWDQIQAHMRSYGQLALRSLPPVSTVDGPIGPFQVCETQSQDHSDLIRQLRESHSHETPFQVLIQWIGEQTRDDITILIICRRSSHVKRLTELLAPYRIEPVVIDTLSDILAVQGRIYILTGIVATGFHWPDASVALITDEEIFGTHYRKSRAPKRPKSQAFLNYEDLKQGDWVVHTDHGIGQYDGLVKLAIEGSINDFIVIRYQDDDKLYLPVDRMDQVQKYIGVDGVVPVIDKMGGKTWDRVKLKVKRTTEKIAGELLKLYAARKARKGHAFGSVDTCFKDFEDGFPYEETSDQRKAIEQVLDDMRQEIPMDRLVCGDVGYGKTEVALRAAFLAISEAKQVAVLVPTTVLAEQHLATFKQRFKRYPVQIACMSRFRPAREQQRITAGLKAGTIDIVIGTHRLLQKDIQFKSLGLLVLDEEQRFGVRHKEKIKQMRQSVEVLTLTATPIPRTLHFSLLGIRDISIISTPPEQRRPIITYITEFDDTTIAEAIHKELTRKGQLFFVHNNIKTIDRMASHIQSLVPGVRMAVAHGRMEEDRLERVMLEFMNHQIDLLVCTTIIESGLDIASANTIIINRADRFGLAQIYQLRGRVGRSEEQAYAYLIIPKESSLTKDAQKRLKVLMQYSDLGSGFQIAMSDLKIRGGGTLLGASQSGHIAAVGYDTFLKLMESSISEMKGEPVQQPLEPEINMPLSTFLPETYMPDIDQRLSFYRRLARMTDLKEISTLKAEITDRFGMLPEEASNLLLKIMLKILAGRAGCKRLDLTQTHLVLQFSAAHQLNPLGIITLIDKNRKHYRISSNHQFKARLAPGTPNARLSQTKNILIEIARHVNQ
jgi:transcription-repair coupling factor (superfamily II helicase)